MPKSRGKNLAVTVLHVPRSLDSGPCTKHQKTKPQTPNTKPQTPNPNLEIRLPKPETWDQEDLKRQKVELAMEERKIAHVPFPPLRIFLSRSLSHTLTLPPSLPSSRSLSLTLSLSASLPPSRSLALSLSLARARSRARRAHPRPSRLCQRRGPPEVTSRSRAKRKQLERF